MTYLPHSNVSKATLPFQRETKKAAKVPSHRRQNPCRRGIHFARLVNSVRVSVMNRVYSMPRMLTCLLITLDGV
jgi:hypothetical protein